jgi:hypothetical protein
LINPIFFGRSNIGYYFIKIIEIYFN